MTNRRAFTLLELMVVLVILAITATAVVPAYAARQPETDARRAATTIADLLIETRSMAREQGIPATFVLSPSDARFWISTRDSSATGLLALAGGVQLDRMLPARVECRFEPGGKASPCVIPLRGAHEMIVHVDAWSGEVRVDNGHSH